MRCETVKPMKNQTKMIATIVSKNVSPTYLHYEAAKAGDVIMNDTDF